MAYNQEPGRAPINAYGPLKEVGLIRPFGKKKNQRLYFAEANDTSTSCQYQKTRTKL